MIIRVFEHTNRMFCHCNPSRDYSTCYHYLEFVTPYEISFTTLVSVVKKFSGIEFDAGTIMASESADDAMMDLAQITHYKRSVLSVAWDIIPGKNKDLLNSMFNGSNSFDYDDIAGVDNQEEKFFEGPMQAALRKSREEEEIYKERESERD